MRSGTYESSEGNNVGTAVTFLLIGIGIGAATALVLAPKTGKQFRKDLKRGYSDARDRISDWSDDAREAVGEMRDRVSDLHETVRDKVSDAMDRGADIAENLREKATPLGKVLRRS
jgi:gas vesicle protein